LASAAGAAPRSGCFGLARAPCGRDCDASPVVAHNSSSIRPFSALLAHRYRVAMVLVTARRWLIVSPMIGAYRRERTKAGRRALGAHSPMSQRPHLRAHFW
jgi:hypothetical protein